MMMDIFTSFDPHSFYTFSPKLLIWFLPFFLVMSMYNNIWNFNSNLSISNSFLKIITNQINQTSSYNMKFSHISLSTIFMSILIFNLWGIFPYTFSITTHLSFTLALALPMWLGMIISSFYNKPMLTTASFLPGGAPNWLNPFLVIIESISMMVRPITLAFRLAANMSAGHIVLTLISIYLCSAIFSSPVSMMLLLFINSFYIAFELGICLVQSFIFCLLITLYANDHQ